MPVSATALIRWTGPSQGAVPQPQPPGPGAVTAQELRGGREEGGETKGASLALPPCAAHHVSVRGAARTGAPRGKMVRCCGPCLRPNLASPRLDLRKVRVHVQRPCGGGGGGSRGPGYQPPRLEGPGPGDLSQRAHFRYWGASRLVGQCLRCAPTPLQRSFSEIGPCTSAESEVDGGSPGESSDVSGFAWPLPTCQTFLKLEGVGWERQWTQGVW